MKTASKCHAKVVYRPTLNPKFKVHLKYLEEYIETDASCTNNGDIPW